MKYKFFNNVKYWLDLTERRWTRTADNGEMLSHDVWNFFHPGDPILKGDGYAIHHENGDSSDDRVENLRKMKRSEHSRMHGLGHVISDETKQKISDAWTNDMKQSQRGVNLGKQFSNETRQKISDANLGHVVTDKTKQKISNALTGNQNVLGNQNTVGKHWSCTNETKQKIRDYWTDEKREERRQLSLGDKNPNWKGNLELT